jgi:WD40 repeat protein
LAGTQTTTQHNSTSPLPGADGESAAASQIANPKPQILGDYELLEEIARGGMGVVYKARQISLNRTVAVKMILAGEFAGNQVTRRFQGEAAAAAVLQHPNIVAVHEVGVHRGHHFFSMDYVQGQNLAQLVGSRPLPPLAATRYVKIIAQAIHYAHGQGILHRDLKPSNVLVDAATDEPRVTDFGLARQLEGESSLTVSGQVLGSPHFMPPEQAKGSRSKVGRPSDVFGLGAILYYLLTARAPFQGETLETVINQLLHVEPVSPRLLNPAVSLDLETVCLKCLEKEPERRYGRAQELAEELERVLKDEPIRARPVGRVKKVWRWCRRSPVVASLSGATLLLLLAVAIGGPVAAIRIAEGRSQLEQNLYFSRVELAYREVQKKKPALALKLLYDCPAHLRDWEWYFVQRQCWEPEPQAGPTSGSVVSLASFPKGRDLAVVAGEELQLWTWVEGQGLKQHGSALGRVPPIGYEATQWVAFSPDGNQLAAVSTNFTVIVWDVAQRTNLHVLKGHTNTVLSLAFHPKAGKIATAGNDIRIWDAATGRQERVLPSPEVSGVNVLAFSTNGQWLAAATFRRHLVELWDANTWNPLPGLPDHPDAVTAVAFSPDPESRWIATGCVDGSVRVWERSTRRLLAQLPGHSGMINSLVFSQSGRRLFTASVDREIKVWDFDSRREVLSIDGHQDNISSLALVGTGQTLISGGFDRTLRVWNASPVDSPQVASAETVINLSNRVWGVAFKEEILLLACGDGIGRRWSLGKKSTLEPPFDSRYDVSVSADGTQIVTTGNLATGPCFVSILDASTLKLIYQTRPPVDATFVYYCGALSPDGKYLVTGGEDMHVTVWDRLKDRSKILLEGDRLITDLKFSPDGHHLACIEETGMVRVWDAARLPALWSDDAASTNDPGRQLLPATALREHARVAFSPNSRWLASGDGEGGVIVVDVESGKPVWQREGHSGVVLCVAFSPDGRLLASAGTDRTIRLWDLKSGRAFPPLFGHTNVVNTLAFSPDGQRLVSGSLDQTVRVWSINTSLVSDAPWAGQ